MALDGNSYLNAYLPTCEAYGWIGGPEFSTQITRLSNGREHRNAQREHPQHRYTTSFLNISSDAARALRSHFMVMKGMLRVWRYIDHIDSEAEMEDFAVADGTQTLFKLGKFSTLDGVEYYREVHALRGEQIVYINDTEAVDTVFDMDRGTVEFSTPPESGAILSWSGGFDTWVRFDNDYLPFSIDQYNAHNGQVNLLEMPPPPLPPITP